MTQASIGIVMAHSDSTNRKSVHIGKRTAIAIVIVAFAICATCVADDSFIVRASSTAIGDIAQRHNLTLVQVLDSQQQVFRLANTSGVPSAQMELELEADPKVLGCEVNRQANLSLGGQVNQSTAAILDGGPLVPVTYFGDIVPSRYVSQRAASIIELSDAREHRIDGTGIVAIIDTGVDSNHPALRSSLLPGYDFVHDWAGTASEFADIPADVTAALTQSTAAILDSAKVVQVNQSTAAILDQSTAAILDGTKLPVAFGHGTMVAGIVHLTAPAAQIMPLKAFSADGTGDLSDIIRAIYYAADHNANVMNMSFSIPDASPELVAALDYAYASGVVLVASVGNTGQPSVSFPAALSKVIGVGSTSNLDRRSAFSSYGPMVYVGAPGEGIITTYPGGKYAAASGTSFSAPFVSGTADLLLQVKSSISQAGVSDAIGHAKSVSQMGKGRLDIETAINHAY